MQFEAFMICGDFASKLNYFFFKLLAEVIMRKANFI